MWQEGFTGPGLQTAGLVTPCIPDSLQPASSSHREGRCERVRGELGTSVPVTMAQWVTLPTNVHLVKTMVFLVVTYGSESWTIKKAERPRIDAFEL